MKNIYISVTNDLITDQRVYRTIQSLLKSDSKIILIGRKLRCSGQINPKLYNIRRFRLIFNKGILFYAEFNIRLFFFLLRKKVDVLIANDLDTLLANYLCAFIKKIPLIYDSHEYYTEVPELINKKYIRKFWLLIERITLPKIKHSYTVSASIAAEYSKKYHLKMKVIRNLPLKKNNGAIMKKTFCPDKNKMILYQGVLSKGRGIESVIKAMKYINNACFVIIGDGILKEKLKKLSITEKVENKVRFLGKIPYKELHSYTVNADIAILLEENLGKSYYYSLPNKLFDYIQANVPILSNDFPETSQIINDYNIGITITNRDPQYIGELIEKTLSKQELLKKWKHNLKNAANDLCWENEEEKLISIFIAAGISF